MWKIFLFALLCVPATAGTQRYRSIQVARFSVDAGVKIPADYMAALEMELLRELEHIKGCELVVRETTQSVLPEPVLRLTGMVREFKPRGRWMRDVNKIVAHIRFLDRRTNDILYEADIEGKLVFGVVSGDMEHATRGLAKKIAEAARSRFFR